MIVKRIIIGVIIVGAALVSEIIFDDVKKMKAQVPRRPNILFAIADDQSFPHFSALGSNTFRTPHFDAVAKKGVLFLNAFVAAPQCSPSRAALLTGRPIWQLEEAGTHSSYFPKKFPVFTDGLERVGYFLGYTGKPWGPGNFEDAGWSRNPVGPAYNRHQLEVRPTEGIHRTDYAANFKEFLSQRPSGQPFFFWYGGHEPHRVYEMGSGKRAGFTISDTEIPDFLPRTDEIRKDLLDYALEIEWFDFQLGQMIELLDELGELDNTIIVVTADNGMAFPHAKANLHEFGIHVPLAICGPGVENPGRIVDNLVSLIDLCPTFLEAGSAPLHEGIVGRSLWPILKEWSSENSKSDRNFILTGRERHTHARPSNVGYPARAIRTADYLYILNLYPDRWPVGDPPPQNNLQTQTNSEARPVVEGYEDIDSSPSKTFMIEHQNRYQYLFQLAFQKRGAEELYDIKNDPYCLKNLASSPKMKEVKDELKRELIQQLTEQADPRIVGGGEVFDSYPRFGAMRLFEGFRERGKYNPEFSPKP
ncbi:MAG: sulfatase [Spirosomataceae bacterium]